jgi:hypothetical protein
MLDNLGLLREFPAPSESPTLYILRRRPGVTPPPGTPQ